MLSTYTLTEVECVRYLLQLDRLGFIELRPLNRYRLKVGKGFCWRPHGPVMAYFREHVAADYYSGGFDGEGETLMLVHGQISTAQAASFVERLQRVGQDFAQQHLADQKLKPEQKRAYTLVVGMRSWLFAPFRDLKRGGRRRARCARISGEAGTQRLRVFRRSDICSLAPVGRGGNTENSHALTSGSVVIAAPARAAPPRCPHPAAARGA